MEQTNKRPLVILTGPPLSERLLPPSDLPKRSAERSFLLTLCRSTGRWTSALPRSRPEEMDGVPHHLVDVLDPSEDFNVVLFQQMAKEAMEGIYQRGHIPIVVGGTGFYIQALLYDIDFTENNADTAYREELEALAKPRAQNIFMKCLKK